jgi:hypothetical protein
MIRGVECAIGEREVTHEQVTKGRRGGPIFAANHRSVIASPHHITERDLIRPCSYAAAGPAQIPLCGGSGTQGF